MNPVAVPIPLEQAFLEKNRLLKAFSELTREYYEKFKSEATPDQKLEWVDEISDIRERHLKTIQLLDVQIESLKGGLTLKEAAHLQSSEAFRATLEETFSLIREIQLTDQSLFLYIQNIGFELRAQIVKGLKEKETLSKFKSQNTATGEGLDHTV